MKAHLSRVVGLLFLVGIGIGGRLLPHPPNFTPVEAVSLYAGAWAGHPLVAAGLIVLVMGLTDAFLGWHGLLPFTWGCMVAGTLLGRYVFPMQRYGGALTAALTQASLFFLITNFGVWLQGWYGFTWAGLFSCYVAAIPFFHYQLLGAVFYTSLFWVLYYRVIPRWQSANARAETP